VLAVDTNVVVRYLTDDDPRQSARARRLIDRHEVWVPTTILLETEWVLRSAYGYGRAEVADALRRFAGLPRVSLESPAVAAQALEWSEQGMDLADALHLAASVDCEAFVTFDSSLVKSANRAGAHEVRMP